MAEENDGIEDDRLRLILPLPNRYDTARLATLAEGGRIAALVLPPGSEPAEAAAFGRTHRLAAFAQDDLGQARGLDGVLLSRPAEVGAARQALARGQLVGASVGIDRHEAMLAGEAGADWLLFGRPDLQPDKAIEAAAWWTELFVLPCGVTGLIEPAHVETLAAAKIAFVLPGPSCWQAPDPFQLLAELDQAVAAADRASS